MIKLKDYSLRLKKQNNLSNSKFIAPEIIAKKKSPNIISDVYSIGAIMKLLLESTKKYIGICTTLVEDCLQIDTNKRIQFDALIWHPYFTWRYPVYKFVHGNLLFNIRLFLHL